MEHTNSMFRSGDFRSGDFRSGDFRSGEFRSGEFRSGGEQSLEHPLDVSSAHDPMGFLGYLSGPAFPGAPHPDGLRQSLSVGHDLHLEMMHREVAAAAAMQLKRTPWESHSDYAASSYSPHGALSLGDQPHASMQHLQHPHLQLQDQDQDQDDDDDDDDDDDEEDDDNQRLHLAQPQQPPQQQLVDAQEAAKKDLPQQMRPESPPDHSQNGTGKIKPQCAQNC